MENREENHPDEENIDERRKKRDQVLFLCTNGTRRTSLPDHMYGIMYVLDEIYQQ
jgi:hypothetical protein